MTGALYPPFYPPAYPIAPVPAPVPERLIANGVDLNAAWCKVEGLRELLAAASRRGENVTVPGRHGLIRTPRKKYNAVDVVVPMHVLGVNRTSGDPVTRAASQLHENIDYLLHVFHTETVQLEYVRDDGTSRVAVAELAADPVVAVRERSAPPLARVSVALRLADAFWRSTQDVSQTITGVTGTTASLTAFAGSTAPIADCQVTFHGPGNNPRIAIGDRWLQFNGVIGAGRQLVLDCEHWHASAGTGSAWSPSVLQVYREPGPAWLEIPPSHDPLTVTFTHSGGGAASVEIAGRKAFLSP